MKRKTLTAVHQVLKEAWEVEKSTEILMEISEERKEVLEDLADTKADIRDEKARQKIWQKRLDDLTRFKADAELRITQVEHELTVLDAEAIQQGWGSAYDEELDRLNNKILLAAEETRLLRVLIRRCQDKIQDLSLEVEDVEADLDANSAQEVTFPDRWR